MNFLGRTISLRGLGVALTQIGLICLVVRVVLTIIQSLGSTTIRIGQDPSLDMLRVVLGAVAAEIQFATLFGGIILLSADLIAERIRPTRD